MTDKDTLRRRFLGGGLLSLVVAGVLVFVLGVPADPVAWLPIAWLVVGGAALLVAGARERLPLGVTTVGWPRVAAFGLGVLAIGSSTFGFLHFLEGGGALGLLNAGVAIVLAMVLALVALECWLGGVGIDEDAFVVE